MAAITITSTVTASVSLGVGGCPNSLSIAAIGAIAPNAYDAIGLFATIPEGYVQNAGLIAGGPSGIGVYLGGGSMTNNAIILGGAGSNAVDGGAIPPPGGRGGVGVDLVAGSLSNAGTITGGAGGGGVGMRGAAGGDGGAGNAVVTLHGGSLFNSGVILGGPGGAGGIDLSAGTAGLSGVGVYGTGGMLTNQGTIAGGAGVSVGVNQAAAAAGVQWQGGTLINAGVINGGAGATGHLYFADVRILRGTPGGEGGAGVYLRAGTLVNSGTITGGAGGAGYPFQYRSGGIVGAAAGIGAAGVLIASGILVNDGTIIGGEGGTRASASYAAIAYVGGVGVEFQGSGTLEDAGFIAGGAGRGSSAAVSFGSASSRLILKPGASFGGAVTVPGGGNVLELAGGTLAGSIAGLGSTITGFDTIQVDAGVAWNVVGSTSGLADGQTIAGFVAGDTIELTGIVESSFSVASGGLVLSAAGGPVTLDIQGSFSAKNFAVSSTGGDSFVTLAVPCFAAGTRIATRQGQIPVEALRVGDEVIVRIGGGPLLVIWIGRRRVDCARHPSPQQVWPVRIAAGAFGPNRPHRELFLSPDHAIFRNGVLIPVKYLLNGRTVAQVPTDEVTYYHVELARHEVMLAEGLAVESYLDTGDRMNFANGERVTRMFPDFASWTREARGCAPLVITGLQVDAVRALLNSLVAAANGDAYRLHPRRGNASAAPDLVSAMSSRKPRRRGWPGH